MASKLTTAAMVSDAWDWMQVSLHGYSTRVAGC
jgi:hypothetical protein